MTSEMIFTLLRIKSKRRIFNNVRFLVTSHKNDSEKKPVKLAYNKYNGNDTSTPPLLLLHGILGCKQNWHTIANTLKRILKPKRKIYVLDARNHGESPHNSDTSFEAMAQDVKHFIDTELHVNNVALMGHSMGGLVMIMFALQSPKLIDRLIVIDVSPVAMNKSTAQIPSNVLNILKLMQMYTISKNTTSLPKERQKLYEYLGRNIPSDKTRKFLLKNLIKTNGNIKWQINIPVLIDNYDKLLSFPNLSGEKTYTGPTLFLAGAQSNMIQKSHHAHIKTLFPNVEIQIIENTGHLMHIEKQKEFINIVTDFLSRP